MNSLLAVLSAIGDADPNMPGIQHTLLSLFVQYIAPGLFTAIGGTLVAALLALRKKLGVDGENGKLNQAFAWTAELAATALHNLLLQMKPELQRAVSDGKLSTLEMNDLVQKALNILRDMAGNEGLVWLKKVMGVTNLDEYLRGVIAREARLLGAEAAEEIQVVPDAASELRRQS